MKHPLAALAFFLCLLAFVPGWARADSWAPPSTETIKSANRAYSFTVEPSPLESALAYYRDEVEAAKEGRTVVRPAPMGVLTRRGTDGKWETIWAGPLVNSVAPASMIVSNQGDVVTFDNWGSIGHGEHVIVLYSPSGKLVRTMPLIALLPQDYIDALPHSVSSLQWRKSAAFSDVGSVLLLDVLVPSAGGEPDETVRFGIALADGAITSPAPAQWSAALAVRDSVKRRDAETREARLTYLREPLTAPGNCDGGDWHAYLEEAHFRLTPNWLDVPVAATNVLFAPDNPRFGESIGWLVEAIGDEKDFPGEVAIASPCHDAALLSAMRKAFDRVKPGALSQTILYVSAGQSVREQLEAIIKASGARVFWLDPATAIPQRLERMPGSAEEAAAQEERERRQSAEMEAMLDEM